MENLSHGHAEAHDKPSICSDDSSECVSLLSSDDSASSSSSYQELLRPCWGGPCSEVRRLDEAPGHITFLPSTHTSVEPCSAPAALRSARDGAAAAPCAVDCAAAPSAKQPLAAVSHHPPPPPPDAALLACLAAVEQEFGRQLGGICTILENYEACW